MGSRAPLTSEVATGRNVRSSDGDPVLARSEDFVGVDTDGGSNTKRPSSKCSECWSELALYREIETIMVSATWLGGDTACWVLAHGVYTGDVGGRANLYRGLYFPNPSSSLGFPPLGPAVKTLDLHLSLECGKARHFWAIQ